MPTMRRTCSSHTTPPRSPAPSMCAAPYDKFATTTRMQLVELSKLTKDAAEGDAATEQLQARSGDIPPWYLAVDRTKSASPGLSSQLTARQARARFRQASRACWRA